MIKKRGIVRGINTIYLHGLESNIEGTDKGQWLETYFHETGIIAKDMDYDDPKCFDEFIDLIEAGDVENFVGSSYGAGVCFMLANIAKALHPHKEIKTVLFNPPLSKIFRYSLSYPSLVKYWEKLEEKVVWRDDVEYNILLSFWDRVVDPMDTFNYIRNKTEIDNHPKINVAFISQRHRIPKLEFMSQISNLL